MYGGKSVLRLSASASMSDVLTQIEAATNVDEEIDDIIRTQSAKHPHEILHTVGYY